MLSPRDFASAKTYEASSWASLLLLCATLRKKDKDALYRIELSEGIEEGNFSFPYSRFYLSAKKGHTLLGHRYAKELDEEGKELTTWRTATLKVTGDNNVFENLSVLNDAGDPVTKGQEVALAVYGSNNYFLRCHLVSTQDTLFSGPLPKDLEVRYRGFLPDAERFHFEPVCNYYLQNRIEGTVDFIFGAGGAVFLQCDLFSLDDGRNEYYVSAPSHELDETFGYLFQECRFLSGGAKDNTVYLSRPWRDYGLCVFSKCQYGPHIKKEGYSEWNELERKKTCRYEEYPLLEGRVPWLRNKKSAQLPERYVDIINRLTYLLK